MKCYEHYKNNKIGCKKNSCRYWIESNEKFESSPANADAVAGGILPTATKALPPAGFTHGKRESSEVRICEKNDQGNCLVAFCKRISRSSANASLAPATAARANHLRSACRQRSLW